MDRAVSRVDALVEMVKASDKQQEKKSSRIGRILCQSIKADNEQDTYSAYIDLDRESKRLFPEKVRVSVDKLVVEPDGVKIVLKRKKKHTIKRRRNRRKDLAAHD